ncbi:MAG TPA: hypothetical protein VEA60_06755 [Allosphingosinicella sp.]|nr:hypothetical protein [Allosphingosinicella sp.]
MRMMLWTAGLALAAATAAPSVAAKGKAEAAADPAREICKSRPAIGSRLKKVRTCMTAQEWEDLELQEQVGLGRQQINGAPGCNNDPSPANPCGDVGIRNGGRDTPW